MFSPKMNSSITRKGVQLSEHCEYKSGNLCESKLNKLNVGFGKKAMFLNDFQLYLSLVKDLHIVFC